MEKLMPKREKLEAMLRELPSEEFAALWKNTYDCLPEGSRADLAKEFVAEQYDGELDACIAKAESLLTHTSTAKPKPKPKNKWLPPR
jgi:hypothetical protein